MHPLIRLVIRWGAVTLLVASFAYLILLIGNPKALDGKYSGYELSGHDQNDVIEFENGLVTLKTCCGNSYYGSYLPAGDAWTWEHQEIRRPSPPGFRFKEPLKISVERKLFSATIRFQDGQTLNMRRRVFTGIPL